MKRKFVELATAELITEIPWAASVETGSIFRLTDADSGRQLDWSVDQVSADGVEVLVSPVFVTSYAADRLALAFAAVVDGDESVAVERLRDIINTMKPGERGGYFSDAMRMAGIEQGTRV